ncbi:MAG: thiamine phosphate synthase [Gemmataceae bacterium]
MTRADLLARFEPEWTAQTRLIRALLQEEEGAATQLLSGAGLRIPAYLEQFPWPTSLTDDFGQTFLGEEAETRRQWGRILRLARIQAREMGDPGEISTHHLLAALFSDQPKTDSHIEILCSHGLATESLLSCLFPVPQRVVPAEGFLLNEPAVPLPAQSPSGPPLSASPDSTPGLARIIDACSNRAREGIRVVEDHARFLLNSPVLTMWLKQIRHDLKEALDLLPENWHRAGLQARDVAGDVGTLFSTPGEMTRSGPSGVAFANIKRVQESLRSLEESCKLVSVPAAAALETLRYQAYRVEKMLGALLEPADCLARSHLYVLVGSRDCALGLEGTTRAALEGGADIIQSREKGINDRDWLTLLEKLRKWTAEAGAQLIVNDRPDLALLAGADGVHAGQEDLPVHLCRRIVSGDKIARLVGASTHTPEQLARAVQDGADHAGVGPVFPSGTKHFDTFPGLELVRAVRGFGEIPWFALGGIGPDNLDLVLEAGARRVAVSRCVLASEKPAEVCRQMKARLLAAAR